MSRGEWVRGHSCQPLAEEWELELNTVEHYAAEAWRMVTHGANDADKMRPEIAGILYESLQAAHSRSKFDSVAKLADVFSKIIGARAPDRHQHAVLIAQFDSMDRASKIQWLEEHLEKLNEAKKVLLATG